MPEGNNLNVLGWKLEQKLAPEHGIGLVPFFNLTAPRHNMHRGHFCSFDRQTKPGRCCDCTHFCYTPLFWDSVFGGVFRALRRALREPARRHGSGGIGALADPKPASARAVVGGSRRGGLAGARTAARRDMMRDGPFLAKGAGRAGKGVGQGGGGGRGGDKGGGKGRYQGGIGSGGAPKTDRGKLHGGGKGRAQAGKAVKTAANAPSSASEVVRGLVSRAQSDFLKLRRDLVKKATHGRSGAAISAIPAGDSVHRRRNTEAEERRKKQQQQQPDAHPHIKWLTQSPPKWSGSAP